MRKKFLYRLAIPVLAVSILLTGCDGVFEAENKDGIVSKDNISNGLYILDAKGNYYQPNTDYQTFGAGSMVESADPSRIVYSVNGMNNIPTLYADDKLVLYSTEEVPDSLNVEKFSSIGWTLGFYGLERATGGGFRLTKQNLVPNSDAFSKLSSVFDKSGAVTLYSIDGEDIPSDYSLSKALSFADMEKGEQHTLGIYAGTYYKEIVIFADTKLWASAVTTTTVGYKRTKSNYAEINLGGLEDGYYNFNGTGLVKVVRQENRPTE